jgi:hypothetical protein
VQLYCLPLEFCEVQRGEAGGGAVQGAPELQYGYLKGAMHAARLLEAAAAQQGADPASPRSHQRSPNDWLLSDPQVPVSRITRP